ncbi:pyrroline-5-carboxylate reductase [Anaerosinus massiliensis]|uniref:pyrroline-5-carboxylate reductase n=1 Tax=Massilibacillus massiliensis TaxID=1806837 RepID=UPI000AAE9A06|nr:pyrroline-5-carboxylate reductase [Massilibacillus massiliensis]
MKDVKIGFIGGGAIAEALIKGILNANLIHPKHIFIAEHKIERCTYLQDIYNINTNTQAENIIDQLDIVFLAIKPQAAHKAMQSICSIVSDKTIVVSVVAGLTIQTLESYFKTQSVLRVMPNTPVAVSEGMSAIALGSKAKSSDGELIQNLFNAVGKTVVVNESLMDAVTGLSGSGPGYGFVIIDALADAGVKAGLPRKTAIMLAAQSLLGAAKMVLVTEEHPAQLRDMVTSPAGTTIEGISVLEKRAVRAALIDAVEAATNRSKAMGSK